MRPSPCPVPRAPGLSWIARARTGTRMCTGTGTGTAGSSSEASLRLLLAPLRAPARLKATLLLSRRLLISRRARALSGTSGARRARRWTRRWAQPTADVHRYQHLTSAFSRGRTTDRRASRRGQPTTIRSWTCRAFGRACATSRPATVPRCRCSPRACARTCQPA